MAARAIVPFGFRQTARLGAALILAGFASLVACAMADAGVAWISASCVLIGAGLGPCSISQVLAIQAATHERERGVATALVQALEQSLLPVFAVLLLLAVVQVAVSGWFPGKADVGPREQAAPSPVEDPLQA